MAAVEKDEVPKFLHKLIQDIAKDNGFTDFKIEYRSLNTDGGNYTGSLYIVDITQDGKSLALFAKMSNTTEQARQFLNAHRLYEREVFVYTELANAFKELEDKQAVPKEKRFVFPKLYGSDLTELQEVVVMENLLASGYEMYDRCESMTWEYAQQAIEKLARFHALSHTLRLDEPDKFQRLIMTKEESVLTAKEDKSGKGEEYMRQIFNNCLISAQPEYARGLQKFVAGFQEFFFAHYAPTDHSVLAHGDYRISNLMVKYQEGVLSQLLPLDYQMVYHGNGLNDLFYLLYTGTDYEFRKRHKRECFRFYRAALADALTQFGHDPDAVYPQQLFDQHVEEKMLYGLGIAMVMLPIILTPPGEQTELNDMVVDMSAGLATGPLYVGRFRGIVQEMVDEGYLQI